MVTVVFDGEAVNSIDIFDIDDPTPKELDWVKNCIEQALNREVKEKDIDDEESLFESKLLLEALPMIGFDRVYALKERVKNYWNNYLKKVNGFVLSVECTFCVANEKTVGIEFEVKVKTSLKVEVQLFYFGGRE